MRTRKIVTIAGGGLLVLAACRPGEPPAAQVDAAVAPLPPPQPASEGGASSASDGGGAKTVASGGAPTAPAGDAIDGGVDPGTLPQTRDKPEAKGAAFDARVAALWDAIVHDDPDRGMPFFFPVKAYEQVKAVGDPASDWRRRLVSAYKRDIHGLHKRLGDHADDAKLLRAEVPDLAKWIDPGDEYNKLGYWRVYGTRLVYEVNGKERTFEISSLISWRGEWYVVHLTGFK